MRDLSRFIPGEEIEAVSRWSFGAVDTDTLLLEAQARARQEAHELAREEVAHQKGYAEGFEQGRARALVEGEHKLRAYAEGQGKETARHFAELIASAEAQIAASQQVMAQGVLELAAVIARKVLRQELSVNPNLLLPVVREALGLLAADTKSAIVRLHPQDMEVLQEAMAEEFTGMQLTLLADAHLTPGGCVVAAAGTVVDGTVETRWRRAVSNLGLSEPWEA